MTKEDAFIELWAKYDYCMLGYGFDELMKSMSKREVLARLADEKRN